MKGKINEGNKKAKGKGYRYGWLQSESATIKAKKHPTR